MLQDAIIIGGSYAGLSAALQLARARRRVLVIDASRPRNRTAETSHGFLGRDGRSPGAIAREAREQLMAYPSVEWIDGRAILAEKSANGFSITDDSGETYHARRLILATGVVDELPDVPGIPPRWGRSVFHCPYCHGYELDGRIGVLAVSPESMHQALMLPDWGDTTLFLNKTFEPDERQEDQLRQRGVTIEREPVREITGERADVVLCDGRVIALAGLFTLTRTRMASTLAEQLGCAIEDDALGPYLRTDASKETTVPGVFACGDVARSSGSVALAAGEGALAGVGAHQSLVFDNP
ncbi:NAD(P)/FAD-dependent oxidoreductase [Phyllobacterium endophyticum]|uniref:Thioredoxin reductase n=1 Tax=Phyllobacterium endophyticum TaxID=1149773 RepID=A0A2P7B0D4_9HYPH|nr:NAD(P)/FAD-dependent oxidoreductase [Phyllobacterium endophyticum]MBB3235396.1 thioredoxin reductase [Phyllobacterium endophyticum]PSH59935.1 thioredoxin reductase [Phyllobacterium endophyticum]TYR42097.1 NAD(P)/FAD-dependent oxidoreductase [Phyllobacterium endophyticum]